MSSTGYWGGEEGRLQQVCCRVRDETGRLYLEKQRGRQRFTISLPPSINGGTRLLGNE